MCLGIKRILVIVTMLATYAMGLGQFSIDAAGVPYTIDFDSTVVGVNDSIFLGAGFHPEPSPGQLNSNAWEVSGFTDPDLSFGDSSTPIMWYEDDFTRGISGGGEGTGGVYAFNVGGGDRALGFQPTTSDFTPGYFTLRILNNTGHIIDSVSLNYDIYVFNDQDKANSFNVAYSYNNTTLYTIPGLNFTSPEAMDSSPTWTPTNRSTTITNLFVPDGEYFYVRWQADEVSGSNSMDEFALDNITITFNGDLVAPIITEIHYNPEVDHTGTSYAFEQPAEWFEVYNPNEVAINMRDIVIQDSSGNDHNILGEVLLPPTAYFVFAASCDTVENGNYTACGYDYGNTVPWNNGGDIVELRYPDGGIIDQVNYNSWSILTPGRSLAYIGAEFADNNDVNLWSTSSYREFSFSTGVGTSDLGSPGAPGNAQLLAINDVQFSVTGEKDGVRLAWNSSQIRDIENVQLYHSLDGKHFDALQSELSPNGEYLHRDPEIGNNYYQLEWLEGETRYRSAIRSIVWRAIESFDIYPVPASDKIFVNIEAGKTGKIQVLNAQGMVLKSLALNDSYSTPVTLRITDLNEGWYLLRYISDTGNSFSKSFLKQ